MKVGGACITAGPLKDKNSVNQYEKMELSKEWELVKAAKPRFPGMQYLEAIRGVFGNDTMP
ncbi:hypothetical protein GCM10010911_71330 [Paenibacillus nasutitermitis]|uniref:Uncharacterized protein n=1 Tax=Paenibacillus nasutitermitis TaxID=1652958 RepID=A0A917E4D6_9BACL|nr:hypothetical protein GCM10010911_71330 [Paenibacillus nasutitermitis]